MKQLGSDKDRIKLSAARLMIEERRYETARELLKGVDQPQAVDWMLKIEGFIPRFKFRLSHALALIFFLLCLVLVLNVLIQQRDYRELAQDSQQQLWQAQKFDAQIILGSYCARVAADENRFTRCNAWGASVIETNLALTTAVLECAGGIDVIYGSRDDDIQDELACLAVNGISPPLS